MLIIVAKKYASVQIPEKSQGCTKTAANEDMQELSTKKKKTLSHTTVQITANCCVQPLQKN
jgi:hypothetical protein